MGFAHKRKGKPMRAIDADALTDKYGDWYTEEGTEEGYIGTIKGIVDSMPTIEPEREKGEWTKKELTIFAKGIARSLISKRLAQHWHYDDDTAKEIEFLETLYKKVMEIILYD